MLSHLKRVATYRFFLLVNWKEIPDTNLVSTASFSPHISKTSAEPTDKVTFWLVLFLQCWQPDFICKQGKHRGVGLRGVRGFGLCCQDLHKVSLHTDEQAWAGREGLWVAEGLELVDLIKLSVWGRRGENENTRHSLGLKGRWGGGLGGRRCWVVLGAGGLFRSSTYFYKMAAVCS